MNGIPDDVAKIIKSLEVRPDQVRRGRRDIQVHAAVTIMGNSNNAKIVGEKDQEIAQFAVQLDARHAPFKRVHFQAAFTGLMEECIRKARAAGLMKAGE